ncbi:MAG: pyridoxal-5'-phosphate-dependent protein subunit beta [Planctomycetes bacterium]|nr:pyridoxal-5'-phosphate-dependent protein subunit beta [Planctomycetota bacterium]
MISDQAILDRTVEHFRSRGISLPTLAQLADPSALPAGVIAALKHVEPDESQALNLFRVHWYNSPDRRGLVSVPAHLVLTQEVTGIAAPIVVLLGDRFPMIGAHKVLAAYACLVRRLVTGEFDPTTQRAVWPSTGNYCRGGVAISSILGCRGVAVLPEGMSAERFEWLEKWVADPADIDRTPGTESNVKEIYDRCGELQADPRNLILNQFSEFDNHLAHYRCTGRAVQRVFEECQAQQSELELAAFVSATGSAGTIGAGDYLKDEHGTRIVAVEALECPTMLYNGFGSHNIQGIGDKHIPLIHNVMNTDLVVGISDRDTDSLNLAFSRDEGRAYLASERGWDPATVAGLEHLGLSSLCNILAAMRTARALDLGAHQAVFTVATDGAAMYRSEAEKTLAERFDGSFDGKRAEEVLAESWDGGGGAQELVLSNQDRERIFNLGYFTWVEQQGISLADFEARRSQDYWRDLRGRLAETDQAIEAFNAATGL